MTLPESPAFRETEWPPVRNAIVEFLDQHRPYTVYASTEVDITDALAKMRVLRREQRAGISLHAFVLYCQAQAAAEHPAVLTFRRGRNRLVTFTDADVCTMIDKRLPGTQIRVPVGYTFRAAQTKSLAEINEELRAACHCDLTDDPAVRWRRRTARMPGPIRKALFRHIFRDPFLLRRYYGTIGLTNLQTRDFHNPFVVLPPNVLTVTAGIGNVTDRWAAPAGQETPSRRKVLCLTGAADHDVLDGMAISRFTRRFLRLLESAAGLDGDFPVARPGVEGGE